MVSYRRAISADVPAIAAGRAGDLENGQADPRMAAYLDGTHHPKEALLPRIAFVAIASDRVVGYIAGHLTRRYDCDGEVQYLYVAPAYRRSGVASELLRMLAQWFVEQNAVKVCVNVNVDSPAAEPFYARHGAAPINRYWMVWGDIRTIT